MAYITKAKEILNWEPEAGIKEGITRILKKSMISNTQNINKWNYKIAIQPY